MNQWRLTILVTLVTRIYLSWKKRTRMLSKSCAQKRCFRRTSLRPRFSHLVSRHLHHPWKTAPCCRARSNVHCPPTGLTDGPHHLQSVDHIPLLVVVRSHHLHYSYNLAQDSIMTDVRRLAARRHCRIQPATRHPSNQAASLILPVSRVCDLLLRPFHQTGSRKHRQRRQRLPKRKLSQDNDSHHWDRQPLRHPALDHKHLDLKRTMLCAIFYQDTISAGVKCLMYLLRHPIPKILAQRLSFACSDADRALEGSRRSVSVMVLSSDPWTY